MTGVIHAKPREQSRFASLIVTQALHSQKFILPLLNYEFYRGPGPFVPVRPSSMMADSGPSRRNGRKRTRQSFLLEDSTPSDPALFSSDPPDPSVEHYFSPRHKKQHRGTWWQREPEVRKVRKAFQRNMDSGVFMGSDSSYESLDLGEGPNLNSDDTVADDAAYAMIQADQTPRAVRPVRISEPSVISLARNRIAYFADDGTFEDSEDLDDDIRSWIASHYQHGEGQFTEPPLKLMYVSVLCR